MRGHELPLWYNQESPTYRAQSLLPSHVHWEHGAPVGFMACVTNPSWEGFLTRSPPLLDTAWAERVGRRRLAAHVSGMRSGGANDGGPLGACFLGPQQGGGFLPVIASPDIGAVSSSFLVVLNVTICGRLRIRQDHLCGGFEYGLRGGQDHLCGGFEYQGGVVAIRPYGRSYGRTRNIAATDRTSGHFPDRHLPSTAPWAWGR